MNLVFRLCLVLVLLLLSVHLVEAAVKPSADPAIAEEIAYGAKLNARASGIDIDNVKSQQHHVLVSFCAS